VPVPMWRGRAHSRCGCGKARPSPGADVSRGAPGRVQHCLFACAAVGYRTAAPHTALPRRSCGQRASASDRRTLLPPQLDFVGQPLADAAACSVQSTRTTDDVGPTAHSGRRAPTVPAESDWRTTRRVVRNAQRGVGYNTNGGSTMAANDARHQPYNGRHTAPAACNHATSAPRAAFDGRVRSVESSSAAHYMADMTGPLVRHAEHARVRLSHVVRADLAHVGEQVDGRHRAAELVLHSPPAPARSYNGYIPAATAT
jgi:hypothetical protein